MFHAVTFDVDGIKTWKDIKGRRVFVGPPAGAASVTVQTMIRALTGYEPNKDYKAIKLNWGSGLQAMMDGKLDLFVRPVNPGAAMIEQLGMSKKFRLLDSDTTTEAWKKWLKGPGRFTGTIPANTYSGQVNRDRTLTAGAATFYLVRPQGHVGRPRLRDDEAVLGQPRRGAQDIGDPQTDHARRCRSSA